MLKRGTHASSRLATLLGVAVAAAVALLSPVAPAQQRTYDLTPYFLLDPDIEAGYRAFRDGRHDEARVALERYIATHPGDAPVPPVRYLLAEVEDAAGNQDGAVAQLEAIAAWGPLASAVQMRLGEAYRARGHLDRALDAYALVRPDSSQYPLAVLATATILRQQGLLEQARDAAKDALLTAHDDRLRDQARLLLARVLAELHERELALPHLWTLFWGRGAVAGVADNALASLDDAPDAVDHLIRRVEGIGTRDLDTHSKDLARLLKRRFKGKQHASLRLWVEAELLRRDRKTAQQAIARYEAAYKRTTPRDRMRPYVLYGWAVALRRDDRDLEAVGRYTELAEGWPSHRLTPGALLGAGDLLVYRGLPVQAELPLRRLAEQHPDANERAEALWELGWGAYLAGDSMAAIRTLDLLARTFPTVHAPSGATWAERALYWRGRAETKAGRPDQAARTWREVVLRYPLTYYSTQAYNRLREVDPDGALALRRREPFPPERDPELLDLTRYTVKRTKALDAGVEMARLGLFEEARAELEARLLAGGLEADGALLLASLELRDSNTWRAIAGVRRTILLATYPDAESLPLWRFAYPVPFIELAMRFGEESRVSPHLLMGLMRHESSFNPAVVSHANAVGLTQLLPRVARKVASSLLGVTEPSVAELKEPETNVRIGARFLRELLTLFKDNPVLALAAYNAGPYAVKKWLSEIGHLDTDEFLESLPYSGTAAYTKKVLTSACAYRYLYDRLDDEGARTIPIPQELPDGFGPFMEPITDETAAN